MCVVHDHQQRLRFSEARDEAQGRRADDQAVRLDPLTEAERRAERRRLGRGQAVEQPECRPEQLVQP